MPTMALMANYPQADGSHGWGSNATNHFQPGWAPVAEEEVAVRPGDIVM
jgi:hypothetical protein